MCSASGWAKIVRMIEARDHQLHPVRAAGLERAQERIPELLGLAVTDIETQHVAASVGGDSDRDDDRLGHDPVIGADLAVRRVEEHVGVGSLGIDELLTEPLRHLPDPVGRVGEFQLGEQLDPSH